MQRRLVRKLELEKALSKIKPHPEPKVHLEQYTVSPQVAAEILYIAAYVHNDLIDKTVIDLGCGTGRLAIGAVLLGAKEAIGVDIDKTAVRLAQSNAEKMGVGGKTFWVAADVEVLRGSFDTVLQNPPFGVQRRRADRKFILKSLDLGDKVYSLHKSGARSREFIKRFIERHGGRVTGIFSMQINIPPLFEFHSKRRHTVKVDMYRMEGKTHEWV
ncbi:methyltransferase [Candidatus Bathyarchaeota archaeon]|nr:methyltransferase [Candidatus Bathyarchaeota archaeon]NIU81799.1 methyltransferase [Candidatus Bathyarchaeota archaeon]NIV68441.1 methyltransferase [Candidatus Bathyarchaeota archaeon]NIW16382.1 methyltransferase [Candidatus Bathyarchaeota archaeon]NIW34937.1 methyltransferase [Candidatus Bathyarchaeota archaeon]